MTTCYQLKIRTTRQNRRIERSSKVFFSNPHAFSNFQAIKINLMSFNRKWAVLSNATKIIFLTVLVKRLQFQSEFFWGSLFVCIYSNRGFPPLILSHSHITYLIRKIYISQLMLSISVLHYDDFSLIKPVSYVLFF